MGKRRALGDPSDIKWTWIGEGKKAKDGRVRYNSAQVMCVSGGWKRTFKRGDAVYVAGGRGEDPWVAHMVDMFDAGDESSDCMRCTLRWLYDAPKDVHTLLFTMKTGGRELYFSDHVEEAESNCLDVIQGRAFLCPTLKEMNKFERNSVGSRNQGARDYWKGDVICLVRYFYYSQEKKRVRLEPGELKYLLDHPSTGTLHDVIAPDNDGIEIEKDKFGSPVSNDTSQGSNRSAGDGARDHAADVNIFKEPPSELTSTHSDEKGKRSDSRHLKEKHALIDGNQADDDIGDILTTETQNSQPSIANVARTYEKAGKVRRGESMSTTPPAKKPRLFDRGGKSKMAKAISGGQQSGVMESLLVQVSGRNAFAGVSSPMMTSELGKLAQSIKAVPSEHRSLVLAGVPKMLNIMIDTMIKQNVGFSMGDEDMKSVAEIAAQQFFGSFGGENLSGGSSSSAHSSKLGTPQPRQGLD